MKILSIFEAVHKNLPPEWWRRRGSGSKLHNPDWMKGFYYPLNSWSYSRRIMQCHLLFSFIHQAYLRRSRLNVDMLQFFSPLVFFDPKFPWSFYLVFLTHKPSLNIPKDEKTRTRYQHKFVSFFGLIF